ncbi:hypothetical protein D3C80_1010550 [compost metagenome]
MLIVSQCGNRCGLGYVVDVEGSTQTVNKIGQHRIAHHPVAYAQTRQGISLGERPQQDERSAAALNQSKTVRVFGFPLCIFVVGLVEHQQTLRWQCVEQLLQLVGAKGAANRVGWAGKHQHMRVGSECCDHRRHIECALLGHWHTNHLGAGCQWIDEVQTERRHYGHDFVVVIQKHSTDDAQQILRAVAEHQLVFRHTQLFRKRSTQCLAAGIGIQRNFSASSSRCGANGGCCAHWVFVAPKFGYACKAESFAHGIRSQASVIAGQFANFCAGKQVQVIGIHTGLTSISVLREGISIQSVLQELLQTLLLGVMSDLGWLIAGWI